MYVLSYKLCKLFFRFCVFEMQSRVLSERGKLQVLCRWEVQLFCAINLYHSILIIELCEICGFWFDSFGFFVIINNFSIL